MTRGLITCPWTQETGLIRTEKLFLESEGEKTGSDPEPSDPYFTFMKKHGPEEKVVTRGQRSSSSALHGTGTTAQVMERNVTTRHLLAEARHCGFRLRFVVHQLNRVLGVGSVGLTRQFGENDPELKGISARKHWNQDQRNQS